MTTNNGWPGKPGVPLNPEKGGWHWLSGVTERPAAFEWLTHKQAWLFHRAQPEAQAMPPPAFGSWTYRGPVLLPDEATALQKRVAELEDLIRVKVTEIERAYPHEGHCPECYWAMRAWSDTEHRDDCWYVKARAALEGGEDD